MTIIVCVCISDHNNECSSCLPESKLQQYGKRREILDLDDNTLLECLDFLEARCLVETIRCVNKRFELMSHACMNRARTIKVGRHYGVRRRLPLANLHLCGRIKRILYGALQMCGQMAEWAKAGWLTLLCSRINLDVNPLWLFQPAGATKCAPRAVQKLGHTIGIQDLANFVKIQWLLQCFMPTPPCSGGG